MKNKYVKIFFTFIIGIVCLFGIDYVDAKTVAMGIKSNKTTVEPGDTIRIDLPVLCVAKGTNVSKIDTGFEYDSNALTATEVKNVKYFNGWKNVKDNLDDKNGSFVISLKADSSKNYINSDNASGDCGDDTYVTLVSGYELKVKDVANQKTTIWVLQDGERNTSIDINIYNTKELLLQKIREDKIEIDSETPLENLGYGNLVDQLYKKIARPYIINPVFLTKHPISLSPLARANDSDPTITDRFQLVINGAEIINAYSELVDPIEQEKRLLEQARLKANGDEESMPMDYDYIDAMEYGMPPISGWGMGIDRLVQLLTNSANIKDVVLFPLMKNKEDITND